MKHNHRVKVTMKNGSVFRGRFLHPELSISWKGHPAITVRGRFRDHTILTSEVSSVTHRRLTNNEP